MGLKGLELKLGCTETLKTQTHSRLSYSLISNPLGTSFHTGLTRSLSVFPNMYTHKIHPTRPLLWDRRVTISLWNSVALSKRPEVSSNLRDPVYLSLCPYCLPAYKHQDFSWMCLCRLVFFQTQAFEGVPQGAELGPFGISLTDPSSTFSQ